jgi:nucleotide-binding universal stress UspA family protein
MVRGVSWSPKARIVPEGITMTHDGKNQLIVVGVDGSAESIRALEWAVGYARAIGARIRAVLAWQYPPPVGPAPIGAPAEVTREIRQHMADLLAGTVAAAAPGPDIEQRLCEGHPAQVLLKQADDADLLVVGATGHAAVSGMFLGSVSVRCVTHASCPVVVVRRSPDRAERP